MWRNVDNDALSSDLKTALSDLPADSTLAFERYNTSITAVVDRHAPLKTKEVIIKPDCPWYSTDLEKEKRILRRLERKKRSTKLQVH